MKHEDDPIDVEKLRLQPEDVQAYAGKAAPRRKKAGWIKVPLSWATELEAARLASTPKVAHRLLRQYWMNGGRPIDLANEALANAGVSRGQKWRALTELENLKLIKIERRPRKSPRITLLKT
jgi:hypothetical protein